ncbi:GGDEF domain-containing protein [Sphingomonas sp. TZW2008]|uniref:GGDEF domain-containing protein n=1 Tax=Sphingomonas sp. TZW2008 TaxID=1917973 RepID=UPI0015C4F882|nr:GGDEF domain-containing protein [Sphingomonas sp. TZW2008]
MDVELGQRILSFLAAQKLAPTPDNYRFGYLVEGSPSSHAAIAVDALLMDNRSIEQADVDRIMATKSANSTSDTSEYDDKEQVALRHQAVRLADLTAQARTSSGDFGRALTGDLAGFVDGLSSVEALAATMLERAKLYEAKYQEASNQIEALRSEIQAARGDARRDALTGLLNRRGMEERLFARKPGTVGVIAVLDLDHFKSINDRFGQAVGDRVLKGVARALLSIAEGCDIARWGGEEFLLLLEQQTSRQAASTLDAICSALRGKTFRSKETDEILGSVTVSIGAVSIGLRSILEAIEEADRLLYQAKQQGRDQVVLG